MFQNALSFLSAWLISSAVPGGQAGAVPTSEPSVNSSTPQIANSSLVVDLGYEIYQGYHNASFNLNTWLGIRYAAPPLGENRWRKPLSPSQNRSTMIQATALPPRCPQGPQAPITPGYDYTGSEDCLFLSVYAPSNATDLPVFVWIHGGGYGGGQGNQDVGNITKINDNGFVSVVLQYRLGAFGFLSSDEVHEFGDVNGGLLDQHFALQWVQQHVHKFGGDPRRVTIAGESAGAGSVMLQAMAYGGSLGASLFENVIAASPYTPMQFHYSGWEPSQAYYAFALAVGCFPGRAYGNTSTTILDCLRSAPSDKLQSASARVGASGTWGTWAFLPVTDGEFIQQRPSAQLVNGKVNGRRVLTGNNAMEGAAFVIPNIIVTEQDFEAWLRLEYPSLGDNLVYEILDKYYSISDYGTTPYATCGDCSGGATAVDVGPEAVGQQQRAINLYSETTFVCPSYWLGSAFQNHGKEAYKYQYSVPAAQHGADLYAEGLRAETPNISPEFYDALTTVWGNFITGNNPSISDLLANGNGSSPSNAVSQWPLFTTHGEGSYKMINFNETGGVEYSAHVVAYPAPNAIQYEEPRLKNDFRLVDAYSWEGGRGARCNFWHDIGAIVPE